MRRPKVLRDLRRLDRLADFGESRVVPGNRIGVMCGGGAAFPAMIEAIEGASRGIAFEMYTWADDRVGWRFAEAMGARARAGIPTYCLVDAFGSIGGGSCLAAMRKAGVEVLRYNPLGPRLSMSKWFPNRRDHRKLLVVDGTLAFTGGLNLAECYSDEFLGEKAWCDLAVRLDGPVVRDLLRLFVGAWSRAGGAMDVVNTLLVEVPPAGSAAVQVLGHIGRRGRRAMRRALLAAIELSRERILLAYAYFVPDDGLRSALSRAARRGVRVDLLLPGPTDVPMVRWASRSSFGPLLRAGVRIRELRDAILHAKAGVFDDAVATLGSANLDYRSLHLNLEVVVNLFEAEAVRDTREALEARFARAEPVTLELWRRRPASERVLERLAFALRYWL